jgi:hypothetical protein
MRKLIRKIGYWLIGDERDAVAEIRDASPIYSNSTIKSASPVSIGSSRSINDGVNGMNFTVFPATGGKVVQFSSYDPSRDRHISNLYVVTDKEDLGEELGQIITKESLSR